MEKSYWVRLADNTELNVPDSHETTVRADPHRFGVRGKPKTGLVRAALDGGWLRVHQYPDEVVFEHAQADRGAAVLAAICFLIRHKIEPTMRVVIDSALRRQDSLTATAAAFLNKEQLTKLLGEEKLLVAAMLVTARLEESRSGKR